MSTWRTQRGDWHSGILGAAVLVTLITAPSPWWGYVLLSAVATLLAGFVFWQIRPSSIPSPAWRGGTR